MKLTNFDYHLPPSLIAHHPNNPRDRSRLLFLNKATGQTKHYHFSDLTKLLTPNDVLVLNQTKVFPARLHLHKSTGGKVEILLIKRLSPNSFEAISKPGLKPNQPLFHNHKHIATTTPNSNPELPMINFTISASKLDQFINSTGATPIPPYIHPHSTENKLRHYYQTVFAKESGSVAAPTAGLHFTSRLLKNLSNHGVNIQYLTLHVGLGTFKPVTSKQLSTNTLHPESYNLNSATAHNLNQAKQSGKRIIAVGTTTTRVLESCLDQNNHLTPSNGQTQLFIKPSYHFRFIDGLITNFHLPQSSLLMLTSAFISHPNTPHHFSSFSKSHLGQAYQAAIDQRYRFYSFGDAMIII